MMNCYLISSTGLVKQGVESLHKLVRLLCTSYKESLSVSRVGGIIFIRVYPNCYHSNEYTYVLSYDVLPA